MYIQSTNFAPLKPIKVYLLKEERAALAANINLPDDLKSIVSDDTYHVNSLSMDWDAISEDGLYIPNVGWYAITWLNSPADCKRWLKSNAANELKIILRTPKVKSKFPYDFPRALISKRIDLNQAVLPSV